MRTAFYSGSFDPLTLGHTAIIARAARVFDALVVGVGVHHGKAPMFSGGERVAMVEAEIAAIGASNARAVTFNGLVVNAAREHGATVIVRGLRDGTDFDYEMQMAGLNGAMAAAVETVFFAASPETRHIAASFVRQIAVMGGDASQFVPASVQAKLRAKFPQTP